MPSSLLPTTTSAAPPGPLGPLGPLDAAPPTTVTRPQPRTRTRIVRLAASFVLLASSAVVLLSSSEGDETGGGRHLADRDRDRDPLLTSLVSIEGTTSASDAAIEYVTSNSRGDGEDSGAAEKGGQQGGAKSVTPIYWHIYKAGGTSVKSVLTQCLELTTSSNMGVLKGHDEDTEIAVMRAGGHSYVNVDTITRGGIGRAASLGLAESGLADAIITPIIHKTIAEVFSPRHRGMLFTVFRHPVDRLVSQYYYLQEAQWEATYNPDIGKETLGQYAVKFNNRLMRQLVGKDLKPGPLTESDLDLAKEVIRTRTVVGLVSDVEGAARRFVRYFGWERPDKDSGKYEQCMADIFHPETKKEHGSATDGNRHEHAKIEKGSKEWREVAESNEWDIKLYEYVLEVYEEQGRTVFADMAAVDGENEVSTARVS